MKAKTYWPRAILSAIFLSSQLLAPTSGVAVPLMPVASGESQETSYKELLEACNYPEKKGEYQKRCSTEDLQKIISHIAEGGDQAFDINNANAAKALDWDSASLPDDEAAAKFKKSGGLFTKWIEYEGLGKLLIQDNNFTYKWSLEGPGERVKVGFNHIIPQRNGQAQPEMKKFIKEGDVIVFFHPENRGDSPDTYNQWRASHAATIVERKNADGTFSLATADTPAGYARPFDGNDNVPFHVFRFVPRDREGKPVADWKEYGKSVAKWASLGFGKFDFNGDYGSMNLKSTYQLKRFKKAYLSGEYFDDEFSMYCAWFVFTNLNLGYHFPFNIAGLGSDWQETIKYATRQAERPYQCLASDGLVSGDEERACYGSKEDLTPQPGRRSDRELAFHYVSAPQLIMNFVNKLLGPDKINLPKAQPGTPEWAQQVQNFAASLKKKAGFFQASGENFYYNLQVQDSDSRGWDPAIQTIDSDEYNRAVKAELQNGAYEYNRFGDQAISEAQKLALLQDLDMSQAESQVRAGQIVAEVQGALENIEKQLKDKMAMVIENARTKAGGKAWMPPYGYMAEADGHEEYWTRSGDKAPTPQLVYVGTVIHENLVKEYGAGDSTQINVVGENEEVEEDQKLKRKIRYILSRINEDGEATYTSKYFSELQGRQKYGYYGLMWYMIDESREAAGSEACYFEPTGEGCYEQPDPGLNVYEALTLRMAMRAWNYNELRRDEDKTYHNDYGVDQVLARRMVAAKWNWHGRGEKALAPAVYGGSSWWASKMPKNTRLLMSMNGDEYPAGLYRNGDRNQNLWLKSVYQHKQIDARNLLDENGNIMNRRPRRMTPGPCFQGASAPKDILDKEDWEYPSCK